MFKILSLASTVISVALLSSLLGCKTSITSTTLPNGFHHEGAKSVVVVPEEPDSYDDSVAQRQMEIALGKFALFHVTSNGSDAELLVRVGVGEFHKSIVDRGEERVTSGEEGVSTESVTGWTGRRSPDRFLRAEFYTAQDNRLIYSRSLVIRGDFTAGQVEGLCRKILKYYARGQ